MLKICLHHLIPNDRLLTRLANLLQESSKGRHGKNTAILFRKTARTSIGSNMPAKSLELRHTLKLICELDAEILEIEQEITGLSPSTYQSGKLKSSYSHMEKRGSKYLRYTLFNASKFVCLWDTTFAAYLAKKSTEGKYYNVAVSHAAKKLVQII